MSVSILFAYYKLLLFLLYVASSYQSQIAFHILQSSILHFAPSIKLHHIVLLSDKPTTYVYTLDFTPINQTHIPTLLKMLAGQNVPAEVRLRYIESSMENFETIMQKWSNMINMDEYNSAKLSKNVYKKIYDKQVQNIVNRAFAWSPYMNLYNHNCQHFSHYVIS
jgi:hypothetical protein